jgi:PAS domain S-box-containing protein
MSGAASGAPAAPDRTAPATAKRALPPDRSIVVVVGAFVAVVALLLYVSFAALEVLSWARAYVAAEGAWSRAQKDAVIALQRYARSGQAADFAAYERAMAVPLAGRRAREELEKPDPDMELVRRTLAEAGNHAEDIRGFTVAIRAFRWLPHVDQTLAGWRQGDRLLVRVRQLADDLRREMAAGSPDRAWVGLALEELVGLNARLTELGAGMSGGLGEGARQLKRLIMAFILGSTALVVVGAVAWSWSIIRRMRETEDALRRSEEKYRSLVNHATYGMYRSTLDGRFLAVNPALVEMLGYRSEDDVLGLSMEHDLYLYPDDRARLIRQYREAAQVEGVEVDWRRRDGTPLTVRLSGRPFQEPDGRLAGFEMIVEDVTERKVLEEQLRQSQKMEAVGRLTGGIAHDLNNLLTVILANADLLASSLAAARPDAESEAVLRELREAARRGAAMIRKLLAFSRREKLARAPIDLGGVVTEASRVLRRLLPEHIEIDVVTEKQVPPVSADAGAVEQMLVNLATNARDAMPGGGVLRIEVLPGRIDQRFAARRGWGRPGDYVCLRVSDTGSGMDPETQRRIFEPFFTTKAPGSGTGLGMAMIYGLVKQHDGFIDVESRRGAGTTVTIYLPITAATAPEPVRQPLLGTLPRGTETVLVVEDEAAIRDAARRGLERLGYRVLLAADGEEGLELFGKHASEVDLILTDIVMPRMTGTRLYQELRTRGADVKVLFTSGYTLRDGPQDVELDPGLPLLRKPWTLGQLAVAIREVLDAPAAVPPIMPPA